MASFRKMSGGRTRVEVFRKGIRRSKIFDSKAAARDWAARQEYLILNGDKAAAAVTFGEVMARYAREVSPGKRGEMFEARRLKRFQADAIAAIKLRDLSPAALAGWRDRRRAEVSDGTVLREMGLLSSVLTMARREWGLIQVNPMSDVVKPREPRPRDRLVTDRELEMLAVSAGEDLTTKRGRAFHAFKFAIETAMRAGEITGMVWGDVDLDHRTAHLPMTKNGTARDVPLSSEAVRLLQVLPALDPVWGMSARDLDVAWRSVRDRAGVKGLTFHDSRHTAITRLAKKLDVLDLARMVGHRNLNQLLIYYNATAEELAKRLD